jgi:hypothetical protein
MMNMRLPEIVEQSKEIEMKEPDGWSWMEEGQDIPPIQLAAVQKLGLSKAGNNIHLLL